jgi:hypothetical protein
MSARPALAAFFVIMSQLAAAVTHTATSCSQTDVAKVIAQASNGDTVIMPACPAGASWTSNLTVTKGIYLIGSGQGVSVIIDNLPRVNCRNAKSLITIDVAENLKWRLSNFTIQGSEADPGVCSSHVRLEGASHSFRVDHISFNNMQTYGIKVHGDLWGVIDHNTFNGNHKAGIYVAHESWGSTGKYGDNSWAQADTIGTEQAVFIEDNEFNIVRPSGAGCLDSFEGGRLVFRYNRCPWAGSHGTDSGQRNRGIRQFEIYNNTYSAVVNGESCNNCNTMFMVRAGTGVVFNNSATTPSGVVAYNNAALLANYRDTDEFVPWGACDGSSPYDNDGAPVAKGTYDGPVCTNCNLMIDPAANFGALTADYTVRNVSQGWGATIQSNTRTTITNFPKNYAKHKDRSWKPGDTYEIHATYPCLDQPGRGSGALLGDDPPKPESWPTQALRPIYAWLNTKNGVNLPLTSHSTHVQANRDFYDYNASFEGKSGVGVGPLSARPAKCQPLVAYWATDSNTLYQCSNSDTWTSYYKPYTYPHPLQREFPDPAQYPR